MTSSSLSRRLPERVVRTALLLLGLWLAWAWLQVDIDLDDGYATIANAQYFLGLSDFYAFIRGPLVGLVLVPVEWLASAIGRPPLEVRAHHGLFALVHVAYLVACWRLLLRVQPADWPSALAWLAAIPTVVFFSYAPYLNHDLFPGALALWMVFLAHRFVLEPSGGRWLGLVLLGAALPLIKPPHALVWVAILASEALLLVVDRAHAGGRWRPQVQLLAAAAASGLLTWVVYAWAIVRNFGDVPFWWRPWELILLHTRVTAGEGTALETIHQGVYLHNLSAYGMLAMALVIPGACLALARSDVLLRRVAIVGLLLLLALLLTPLKEVRYLALLAPFSMLLIAPVLREAAHWKAALALAAAVLVADFALRIPEAMRIAHPWYGRAVAEYFEPLPDGAEFTGTLYMGLPQAFVAPEADAFFGDRYHRITHISIENLVALKRIPIERTRKLAPGAVPPTAQVAPGDYWVMANAFVARSRPFVAGNREGLAQDFNQFLAVAEWLELRPEGTRYVVAGAHASSPHLLSGPTGMLAGVGSFDAAQVRAVLGVASDLPPRVLGFRILRLCTLAGCQHAWPPG